MHEVVEHNGIVESIEEGCVRVRILQTSACAACKAKSFCASSENKEKVVEVRNWDFGTQSLKAGDEVVVCATTTMGRDAVVLAFVVPLVIMIAGVFVTLTISGNEPLSALIGILVLVPYYLVLFMMKERLQRRMRFWIKKN